MPLCVDLDGCLIKTDSLIEGVLGFIKTNPHKMLFLFLWVFRGKSYLKKKVAENCQFDFSELPYNEEVIEYVKKAKSEGRKTYLVTGANHAIGKGVCRHLKIFDKYYASTERVNLVGKNKAILLNSLFKEKGFDYIGNSSADMKVWPSARRVIAANVSAKVESKLNKKFSDTIILSQLKPVDIRAMKKVLRPHQWAKNVLVFLPMILANEITIAGIISGLLAFVSFSLAASSGYVFNDMLDISSDRKHEQKRFRPIASGNLTIESAFALIPILLGFSMFIGLVVSIPFTLLVLGYFLLSATYTVKLKKIEVIDVIVLSLFYTIRIYAGGVATDTFPSVWLIGFSSFFFLSLALIKRSIELVTQMESGEEVTQSRGYELRDQNQLSILGSVSGFVSILVLGLYINSDKVKEIYQYPEALWVHCLFLTYWISRFWILTNRGEMSHDPVLFALKDKSSWVVGFVLALSWIIARGF